MKDLLEARRNAMDSAREGGSFATVEAETRAVAQRGAWRPRDARHGGGARRGRRRGLRQARDAWPRVARAGRLGHEPAARAEPRRARPRHALRAGRQPRRHRRRVHHRAQRRGRRLLPARRPRVRPLPPGARHGAAAAAVPELAPLAAGGDAPLAPRLAPRARFSSRRHRAQAIARTGPRPRSTRSGRAAPRHTAAQSPHAARRGPRRAPRPHRVAFPPRSGSTTFFHCWRSAS